VEWRALSCPIVLLLLLLLVVVVNGRRPETVMAIDEEMDGRNDGFLLLCDGNVVEREHRLVNIDGDDDSDGIIRTDFPPSIFNEEHRRGSREDIMLLPLLFFSFLSPNKIEPLLPQTPK